MKSTSSALTPCKIAEHCKGRFTSVFSESELRLLYSCLVDLLERAEYPRIPDAAHRPSHGAPSEEPARTDAVPPGTLPTSERKLEDLKRDELHWSSRDQGWEILIPSVAFKNANSSFFGSKPFRVILPDIGRLYEMIEAWIERHRARLIGEAVDSGTFFVKTAKMTSTNAAYCQNTFYEAWRTAIQRYGIYNPWTKRGAIEGLLPHGPHNVRDFLATHILKRTGSYEQASYAIQDTPDMVAQHYGRFLAQDKSEIAARILNQVCEAA